MVRPSVDGVIDQGRVMVGRSDDPDPAPDPDAKAEAASVASLVDRTRVLTVIVDELQARLAYGALHDEVTGLPNRRQILVRLQKAFDGDGATGGLLSIDLDRIKMINDTLGHDAGDGLLQEASRRFLAVVRPGDLVARVSGDQFVVHCPGLDTPEAVHRMAERITESLQAPIDLPGGRVVATASIGVVHVSGRADAGTVLQDAGLAMDEAKQRGRNRIARFHPRLREDARARLEVENALRDALAADELELHYQPVVRLTDGDMVGVEALLRWVRPGIGVVEPEAFIPVATETGLILAIGRWVIEQSVATVAQWPELYVAANLSARQLADADLVDFVRDTLGRHGVEPRRLCMEMTETDLIADTESVAAQLTGFRDLGVRLAIDDFGTGFATLDYLRRFAAAEILKIDGSFVAGITDPSSHDMAIVSAAMVLADNLGFETIAEGVETEAQRDVLTSLGCGYAQGYLYSRPVTAGEIDRMREIQR